MRFVQPHSGIVCHVYFILATSGSMHGGRITRLNAALRAWHGKMVRYVRSEFGGALTVKIGVLSYASACVWMSGPGLLDLYEQIDWPLDAYGVANVGAALGELDSRLRPDARSSPSGLTSLPIIYFVAGGYPSDDYKSALEKIYANVRFRHATRIGFAFGRCVDLEMVGDIAGDPRLVFQTEDAGLFERLLYLTSTVSLRYMYEGFREIRLPDVGTEVARALATYDDVSLYALCPLASWWEQPDTPRRAAPSACKYEAPRVLRSALGKNVRIVDRVQDDGNNGVYGVDYGGERRTLKLMRIADVDERDCVKRRLLNALRRGSPAPAAVWPQDVVCDGEGRVGFVTDDRAEDSCGLNELICNSINGRMRHRQAVDICLQICMNTLVLHGRGYIFPTLGADCFLVSPWDGGVLLHNCDGIIAVGDAMPDRMRFESPLYLAPELVTGESAASMQGDRHSLAVIVFAVLLGGHPLAGGSLRGEQLCDEERIRRTYGYGARFVFDDSGDQNHMGVQGFAAQEWHSLPGHMRALFQRAFSQEALHDPRARPSELEWMRELARFRSEILVCSCGYEVSLNGFGDICRMCDCSVEPELYMELPMGYRLPVYPGTQLYACQLRRVVAAEEDLDVRVRLIESRTPPYMIGLQNLSKDWIGVSLQGWERRLGPGDTVQVQPGMTLEIEGATIPIRRVGEFE